MRISRISKVGCIGWGGGFFCKIPNLENNPKITLGSRLHIFCATCSSRNPLRGIYPAAWLELPVSRCFNGTPRYIVPLK